MGHNSPAYIHTLVEAIKLAFADRDRYYGDPKFSKIPEADAAFERLCRRAAQADRSGPRVAGGPSRRIRRTAADAGLHRIDHRGARYHLRERGGSRAQHVLGYASAAAGCLR